MSRATDEDHRWLLEAIALSRRCPPTDKAYCVGAIIATLGGTRITDGFSRENDDPHVHAEEAALGRLDPRTDLSQATMYSSLEPCSVRRSRDRTCTQLILESGIRRVVFALREPPLFADCEGVALLQAGGIDVVEIAELGPAVEEVNARVLLGKRQKGD
jgi:diaminohydroxyphosphoribosylaminopyrimidine deaminase/5-amino-6-(5-phosphoribosylamino)uracil reductase